MKITEIAGTAVLSCDIPNITEDELEHEYDYLLAEQMSKNMLQAGLITDEEYEKLMVENRRTFFPLIARIMQ